MTDINVVTTDKLGKGLAINPVTGLLDVALSADAHNTAGFGSDNGVLVLPQGASSGASVTWQYLTAIGTSWYPMGANGGLQPLRVGRDTNGNIWLEGAMCNTSASQIAANNYFAELPQEYWIAGMLESSSLYQLSNTIANLLVAGNTTVPYLKMQYYQGHQKLAVSVAVPATGTLYFPLCIIGYGVIS